MSGVIERWIEVSLAEIKQRTSLAIGEPTKVGPFVIGETADRVHIVDVAAADGHRPVEHALGVGSVLANCFGCDPITIAAEGWAKDVEPEEFSSTWRERLLGSDLSDEYALDPSSTVRPAILICRGASDRMTRRVSIRYGIGDGGQITTEPAGEWAEDRSGAVWEQMGFDRIFVTEARAQLVATLGDGAEDLGFRMLDADGHKMTVMSRP